MDNRHSKTSILPAATFPPLIAKIIATYIKAKFKISAMDLRKSYKAT